MAPNPPSVIKCHTILKFWHHLHSPRPHMHKIQDPSTQSLTPGHHILRHTTSQMAYGFLPRKPLHFLLCFCSFNTKLLWKQSCIMWKIEQLLAHDNIGVHHSPYALLSTFANPSDAIWTQHQWHIWHWANYQLTPPSPPNLPDPSQCLAQKIFQNNFFLNF